MHKPSVPRHRLIVFTDMSTECDDECALLWLLSALSEKPYETTLELIMTDTAMRYKWMQFIFNEKLGGSDGSWTITKNGFAFVAGPTEVNLYLAPSEKEENVIADINKKAPEAFTKQQLGERRMSSVHTHIKWQDYNEVPAGDAVTIVVAAPCWGVDPAFFSRFTNVRDNYVVGTPGGVNCPMPSWRGILEALNTLAPVIYLTPQFTRGVRFPASFAIKNDTWNEHIKRVVWDSTLTMMARRPEIPAKFGDWGLLLRLNAANASFCKTWMYDVVGLAVEDMQPPDDIVAYVQAYVQRNAGSDRKCGAVVKEMEHLGVHSKAKLDENGQPADDEARELLCQEYRAQLSQQVYTCVLTTFHLLFNNPDNFTKESIPGSLYKVVRKRSGYNDPRTSLADIFGAQEAIDLLQTLPLKRLTPAYDVVGMMCAVTSLDWKKPADIGINTQDADASMTLGIQHDGIPILQIGQQPEEVVERCIKQLEIKPPGAAAAGCNPHAACCGSHHGQVDKRSPCLIS